MHDTEVTQLCAYLNVAVYSLKEDLFYLNMSELERCDVPLNVVLCVC